MTLRTDLIPAVDDARALVSELGLRPRAVERVIRTWSGGKLGLGELAESSEVLSPAPVVKSVSIRDSHPGGAIQTGDLAVQQVSARYAESWLRGTDLESNQELLYRVDGGLHSLISVEMRSFEWRLVISRRR